MYIYILNSKNQYFQHSIQIRINCAMFCGARLIHGMNKINHGTYE